MPWQLWMNVYLLANLYNAKRIAKPRTGALYSMWGVQHSEEAELQSALVVVQELVQELITLISGGEVPQEWSLHEKAQLPKGRCFEWGWNGKIKAEGRKMIAAFTIARWQQWAEKACKVLWPGLAMYNQTSLKTIHSRNLSQ